MAEPAQRVDDVYRDVTDDDLVIFIDNNDIEICKGDEDDNCVSKDYAYKIYKGDTWFEDENSPFNHRGVQIKIIGNKWHVKVVKTKPEEGGLPDSKKVGLDNDRENIVENLGRGEERLIKLRKLRNVLFSAQGNMGPAVDINKYTEGISGVTIDTDEKKAFIGHIAWAKTGYKPTEDSLVKLILDGENYETSYHPTIKKFSRYEDIFNDNVLFNKYKDKFESIETNRTELDPVIRSKLNIDLQKYKYFAGNTEGGRRRKRRTKKSKKTRRRKRRTKKSKKSRRRKRRTKKSKKSRRRRRR